VSLEGIFSLDNKQVAKVATDNQRADRAKEKVKEKHTTTKTDHWEKDQNRRRDHKGGGGTLPGDHSREGGGRRRPQSPLLPAGERDSRCSLKGPGRSGGGRGVMRKNGRGRDN